MWITFLASAPESGDSISDSPPDFERLADHLEQSAWWRGKLSPSRVWEKRCKKGGWITVLSGAEICENYQQANCHELTGSPAAIRVNPSPSPDSDKGRTIGDICGPSSNDSFGLFDLEECFSRTWLDTSHSVSVMCLQTWKDLVSDVRSACTQRRKSARRIDENESSSSAWPTPDCTMRPHEGNVRLLRKGVEAGMDKAEADAMIGRDIGKPQGKLKAWPTATVGDSRNSANCTANRKKTGHHSGTTLVDAVRIWPTPHTIDGPQDQEKLKQTGNRPVLSPAWVETLMGFPIGWTDCGR